MIIDRNTIKRVTVFLFLICLLVQNEEYKIVYNIFIISIDKAFAAMILYKSRLKQFLVKASANDEEQKNMLTHKIVCVNI